MLDGKIEGAVPNMAVMEELDGCMLFKQTIDFDEEENEYLFINVMDGCVHVTFAGIDIVVPQSRADIILK